jgi:hypothetical protein
MASNELDASPRGRKLEPRREGTVESVRQRSQFQQNLAAEGFIYTRPRRSAAAIYLIERRAIELRRLRWLQTLPESNDVRENPEYVLPETTFAEYVRPAPDQLQTPGSADRLSWSRRWLRWLRRRS